MDQQKSALSQLAVHKINISSVMRMVVKRQKLDSNRNVKILCERESKKASTQREREEEVEKECENVGLS